MKVITTIDVEDAGIMNYQDLRDINWGEIQLSIINENSSTIRIQLENPHRTNQNIGFNLERNQAISLLKTLEAFVQQE